MASEIQNGWEGIGDAPIPSVPVGAQHPLDVGFLRVKGFIQLFLHHFLYRRHMDSSA